MALTNTCSKVILVLLNLAFIAAGAVFIYYGLNVKNNGWTDIFQGNVSKGGLDTGVIAFGAVVIAIALFGFLGALCRNKCLLVLYSIFVFLAMAIFILLAVLFFLSASTANKWAGEAYPADAENEPDLAIGFDKVYCYAQAANLCMTSSATAAINAFYPSGAAAILSVASLIKVNVSEPTGINGFCNSVDKQLAAVSIPNVKMPSEYTEVCKTCKEVASKYEAYKSIFEWTNEQCPLSVTSAAWCGQFLLSKKEGDAYNGAPYKDCRPKILDLWKSLSNKVAIGSTILAVVSLILLFMACSAGRSDEGGYYHDSV
ncbi:hypothetical protein SDRG_07809 [Saprolegnia diclina VS20]|uniref:Tetraspanin n=1 Tax=Saprolegnia diclina (strain VS20) TaxID=1156394 RepID=T0QIE1_SAPDV|nr:hypothetical protein SDRG_07809 [Saprolegnia diclina VS20]EQC34481.1 hypothetical protein SDRG_07809 [Saprolegnia diclina VS20]|eukprot:XP_008611887.1 hypothetical protein SDRG_07809 [Saprolegnia diclina VS20]